jgi:hypothetical protein
MPAIISQSPIPWDLTYFSNYLCGGITMQRIRTPSILFILHSAPFWDLVNFPSCGGIEHPLLHGIHHAFCILQGFGTYPIFKPHCGGIILLLPHDIHPTFCILQSFGT